MKTIRQGMRRTQKGMTLVVGLIMLIMISLAAVVTYNISKTSLDVVGNMQFQNEAVASADSTIQEALSTTRMFRTPNTVFLDELCDGPNSRCYDLDGDRVKDDMTVNLATPICVRAALIPTAALRAELDNPDPVISKEARNCIKSETQETLGTEGAGTGGSLCANSTWELAATATDSKTGTRVTVTQGAAVRVGTADLTAMCL